MLSVLIAVTDLALWGHPAVGGGGSFPPVHAADMCVGVGQAESIGGRRVGVALWTSVVCRKRLDSEPRYSHLECGVTVPSRIVRSGKCSNKHCKSTQSA